MEGERQLQDLGVPASPSGQSPSGLSRDASQAKPTVPNVWQSIETAPRDGTVIIARVSDNALSGFASSVRESRRYVLAKFVGWWEVGYPEGRSSGGGDDQFTHWMPLPPAPQPERTGA